MKEYRNVWHKYQDMRKQLNTVIGEAIAAAFPGDAEMEDAGMQLIVRFECMPADMDFVHGMLGFAAYAKENNMRDGAIASTLLHDMGGHVREERCFLPRTDGYKRYSPFMLHEVEEV